MMLQLFSAVDPRTSNYCAINRAHYTLTKCRPRTSAV